MSHLNKFLVTLTRRPPVHIIQAFTRSFAALPAFAIPLERSTTLLWNEGNNVSTPSIRPVFGDSSHGENMMRISPASVHTSAGILQGSKSFAGNKENVVANARVMQFFAEATAAGVRLGD